jgi:hypothetical protein
MISRVNAQQFAFACELLGWMLVFALNLIRGVSKTLSVCFRKGDVGRVPMGRAFVLRIEPNGESVCLAPFGLQSLTQGLFVLVVGRGR